MDDRDQTKLSSTTMAEQELGRKVAQENAAAITKVEAARAAEELAKNPPKSELEKAVADAEERAAAAAKVDKLKKK